MDLASFDIFDTLLIRRCGSPNTLFYILSKQLFPNDDAKNDAFYIWRMKAESIAEKKFNTKHATLTQIYDSWDEIGFGINSQAAIEYEKKIEADSLVVNPNVKSILDESRRNGYKICFISDMYLDSNFLQELLERENCFSKEDWIFVSNEFGARKSDGLLFDYVREKLKPRKWIHYGDNPVSDYKVPLKKHIKAVLIDSGYTEAEKYILKQYRLSNVYHKISAFVGFQRLARILGGNNCFAEIAADFVASSYVPYVLYVLNKAKQNKIGTLYFLNRDSFILMKIAKSLSPHFPDIDIKYLYVSRRSLMLPALSGMNRLEFLEIIDGGTLIRKDTDAVLSLLHLNRGDFEKHSICLPVGKIKNKQEENEVLDAIFDSNFSSEFKSKVDFERQMLIDYFRQEGVLVGKSKAMVDIGWLGTSRLMINRILRQEGFPDADFFYFSVRNDVLPLKYGRFNTFMKHPVSNMTVVIEQYFSASPYGSVASYRKNQTVNPIFVEGTTLCDNKIIESNLNCSISIVENIMHYGWDFEPLFDHLVPGYLDILNRLPVHINLSALTNGGKFDEPLSKKRVALVKKMNPWEMFKYIVLGESITGFDNASICLSTGNCIGSIMKRAHLLSRKIRIKIRMIRQIR